MQSLKYIYTSKQSLNLSVKVMLHGTIRRDDF